MEVAEEEVGVVDGFRQDPPHQGQDHTPPHQDPQVHHHGFQDPDLLVHHGAEATNPKTIIITSLTIVFPTGKEDLIFQLIIGDIDNTKLMNVKILQSFPKVQYLFVSISFNIWNSF